MSEVLLRAVDLCVDYPDGGKTRRVLNEVSFELCKGECLGLVGASGSGKSSLARALLHLVPLAAGQVWLGDLEWSALRGRALSKERRRMQMVFQDPLLTLNPCWRIGALLDEARALHFPAESRLQRRKVLEQHLEWVGMERDVWNRLPQEFSGGQRQRIGIARALCVEPSVLVCDEVVSALDVLVQAQVLGLLDRLRREKQMAMLFIGHDLAVVDQLSDRVMVMEGGRVVEQGLAGQWFRNPAHPHTRKLLDAVPAFLRSGEASGNHAQSPLLR
jgi:oligopeptide transport system ATP-binding protein